MARWAGERVYQLGRARCPYCRATPVHATSEMVVFTNAGYRFPRVALTYCLMCEQLLSAHLAESPPACGHNSHTESDIAESDTLPLKNPHRMTDVVFRSCAQCGQVIDCRVHY